MSQKHVKVQWRDQTYDVQTITADMIVYERVARQMKWPMPGTDGIGPITYLTYLCWAAMKRTGVIGSDVSWDLFSSEVQDVDPDEEEDADPTQPAASPGNE